VSTAIEATDLGKRYGRRWALADCTLSVPAGRVVGLVGPNGAGKSTLLHLAVGLLTPSAGRITVLGGAPAAGPAQLRRVGFLAQESPTYARMTVAQHLRMGQWLNPSWDAEFAAGRIEELGLNPGQRSGTLSGGQRAQLALTLAVAKRPELLILDEPVAALDPLARWEFLQTLLTVVATRGVGVVMSSHLIADLERACDHLILLVSGQVVLAGDVDDLLSSHHRLTGARREPARVPASQTVIAESQAERQTTLLVRTDQPIHDPWWTVSAVSLDDVVLAYLRQARDERPEKTTGLAVAR
jgi:ABC-2 type transport system ATP-binding protein